MNSLPNEILVHIFAYLDYQNLIRLERVCHLYHLLVRSYHWNILVPATNFEMLTFLKSKYQFHNYDYTYYPYTLDQFIENEKYHYTGYDFRIIASHVTDQFIMDHLNILERAKYVGLGMCSQITDTSIRLLKNVKEMDLAGCNNITDASVSLLGNANILDLSMCTNLTDASIIHLKNVHTLTLFGLKITDDSVRHLRGVRKLCISNSPYITDVSIKRLTYLTSLIMNDCQRITDRSLTFLIHLKELSIEDCRGITGTFLDHLPRLQLFNCSGGYMGINSKVKSKINAVTSYNKIVKSQVQYKMRFSIDPFNM